MKRFYSHGKLLLTAEYLVLDGALALAVPTRFGQSLEIKKHAEGRLKWTSLNENNTVWFENEYILIHGKIVKSDALSEAISDRLLQILKAAKQLNSKFLSDDKGYHITTKLEFPQNWGLGTSSTLINNIAHWAGVNPYQLLEATFGGSGYDIACAGTDQSLIYQLNNVALEELQNKEQQIIETVDFNPTFSNHIYFVHLNQKQNSREGIARYRANTSDKSSTISAINTITKKMISCETLQEFQKMMEQHEELISNIINLEPIKERQFSDFKGSIKSLGAWGGDFVLVASKDDPTAYFKGKGFSTILNYSEMVLT